MQTPNSNRIQQYEEFIISKTKYKGLVNFFFKIYIRSTASEAYQISISKSNVL